MTTFDHLISIRPIALEDTDNIIRWRNSEFVRTNFIYQKPFTKETHLDWMNNMVATKKVYQFIILEDEKPFGSIYLRDVDTVNQKAEYGVFIGEKDYLGKGYGPKATSLILDFAFDTLNLHKVFLRVFTENYRAIKSYEKAGFLKEACFKDDVCIDGKFHDIIFMSVFNKEV